MGPYGELLAADHRQTLEFFFIGLKDVTEQTVDRDELLYNASVLAHYAQTSRSATDAFPCPANLSDVFDNFIAGSSLLGDIEMIETAAAQCLLLTGFFEKQMQRRYNLRWYIQLGSTFYRRAAVQEQAAKKAQLLNTIAAHFEFWRERQSRLSRELLPQSSGYIIRSP